MNLRDIDSKIIDFFQDGYLYIWDRFGIKIGDIICVYGIINIFPINTFNIIFAVLVVTYGVLIGNTQLNKNYTLWNIWSDDWRIGIGFYVRMYMLLAIGFLLIKMCVLHITYNQIIDVFSTWFMGYIWCAKMRYREPPTKQTDLVMNAI